MGYGSLTFRILSELRRKGTLAEIRRVMDLGAQEAFLFDDRAAVADFLSSFGVEPAAPEEIEALVAKRFVKYLWERVGVEYLSSDYDAQFETLLLDLGHTFRNAVGNSKKRLPGCNRPASGRRVLS
jgi:hypothetical protein